MTGIVSGQNWLYAKAKADGAVIHGVTAVMDSDGNVSVTCGGMTRTSGSNQNSGLLSTDRKKERLEKMRKEKEEMEARMDEKRREKAEFEERLKERRLEREAYLEHFAEENSSIKQYKSADMAQSLSFFDTNA